MYRTRCQQHHWDDTDPEAQRAGHGAARHGPVHNPAIQRLRGSEGVRHGLSGPESTLPNDVVQLEREGKKTLHFLVRSLKLQKIDIIVSFSDTKIAFRMLHFSKLNF